MPQDPESTLRAYVKAFESLDADLLVDFYGLPCLFLAPQGQVVAADAPAARAVASQLMTQAKGQGYRRTEILDLEVRALASELAECRGAFVRLGADGVELLRFGFTYLMRRDGDRWRIVVAAAHDVPARATQRR
jgi:ketosteroid isomerase-like protein